MTRTQAVVKLDIDSRQVNTSDIARVLRRAGYQWTALGIRRSPSGKGWHVFMHVTPRPRSPFEVVALQVLCGGDPYREAVQMNRARNFSRAPRWMRDAWNVLYAPHPHRQRKVAL